MPIDDPQNFAQGLQRQRRLLEESDDVHDADRDEVSRWMRAKDGTVATSTLKTYLRRVRGASERSTVPLVEFDEDAFQDLVFELRHEYDLADATVRSYEDAVAIFLDEQLDQEWVDDVERTKVDSDPVRGDDLLTPADIQALLDSARHDRDVALIEFLADTGARLSLTLSLRVGDVDLEEPVTYTPNENADGLKGAPITAYPLIDSAAPIRSYLSTSHPRPNDEEAALFHKIKPASRGPNGEKWTDAGSLDPQAANQQLKRIADDAGIDAPVNPHAFRHAAITRMVREGFSRSQIEHRVHWTLDTNMWETYEHVTAEQHTDDIFREAGVLESEEGPDRVRKRCGNCRETLAPHHQYCPRCGRAATGPAQELQNDAIDDVAEGMVDAEDMSDREFRAFVMKHLRSQPSDLGHADPSSDSSSSSD